MVGYIEEEDDLDSTDEDGGLTSVNYALPAFYAGSHHRQRSSQSGSDSDNEKAPRGTVYSSPFWLAHRDQPMRFDRLASYSSDGAIPDRPRAKSISLDEKRRQTYSGADDELSRSSGARERRSKSHEGISGAPSSMKPLVGPRMKLSAMAESIVNVESPPMAGASGADAGRLTGLKNAKKCVAEAVIPDNTGLKTKAKTNESNTVIEDSVAEKAAAASTFPTMAINRPTPDFEDDFIFSYSSGRPLSHPLESSRKIKTRLRIRSLAVVGERPVASEGPVVPHRSNVLEPEVRCWEIDGTLHKTLGTELL